MSRFVIRSNRLSGGNNLYPLLIEGTISLFVSLSTLLVLGIPCSAAKPPAERSIQQRIRSTTQRIASKLTRISPIHHYQDIRGSKATSKNQKLHTVRMGKGNKVILMLPPTPGSEWTMRGIGAEMLSKLGKEYSIVTVDMPGAGKSADMSTDKNDPFGSIVPHILEIARSIREESANEELHLMGHSSGAALAAVTAAQTKADVLGTKKKGTSSEQPLFNSVLLSALPPIGNDKAIDRLADSKSGYGAAYTGLRDLIEHQGGDENLKRTNFSFLDNFRWLNRVRKAQIEAGLEKIPPRYKYWIAALGKAFQNRRGVSKVSFRDQLATYAAPSDTVKLQFEHALSVLNKDGDIPIALMYGEKDKLISPEEIISLHGAHIGSAKLIPVNATHSSAMVQGIGPLRWITRWWKTAFSETTDGMSNWVSQHKTRNAPIVSPETKGSIFSPATGDLIFSPATGH